jgi:hypothetical protein
MYGIIAGNPAHSRAVGHQNGFRIELIAQPRDHIEIEERDARVVKGERSDSSVVVRDGRRGRVGAGAGELACAQG